MPCARNTIPNALVKAGDSPLTTALTQRLFISRKVALRLSSVSCSVCVAVKCLPIPVLLH